MNEIWVILKHRINGWSGDPIRAISFVDTRKEAIRECKRLNDNYMCIDAYFYRKVKRKDD